MPIMHTENLKVGFDGKVVLENLSITVGKGQIVSILGPNGSGKSTLLKALSRNLKPNQGSVYLDGKNLAKLKGKVIARKMAVLPQSPQAPKDLTVRDLVEYGRYPHQSWWQGRSGEDDQCVEWALKETSLMNMSDRIVSTLSGGERQRVWIAMALAQKPEILLLDEPTTYLDICHQLEIMELLADFNREHKITVAMVLHDINQAIRYSQDILVLEDGIIKYHGNPVEIMTHETIGEIFKVDADIEIRQGRPSVIVNGLL